MAEGPVGQLSFQIMTLTTYESKFTKKENRMLGLNKKMSDEIVSSQQPKGAKEIVYNRDLKKYYIHYPSRAGWFPCTCTRLQPFAAKEKIKLSVSKRPRGAKLILKNKSIVVDYAKGGNLQNVAEILHALQRLSKERPRDKKGKAIGQSPRNEYLTKLGLM
jgi:hypothetical protein